VDGLEDFVMQQGTDEWLKDRNGKVTGSRFGDVTKAKNGKDWSLAAWSYLDELCSERLIGFSQYDYVSPAMQWGRAQESLARSAYQWDNPCNVAEVGFVDHRIIKRVGCSPDGVIREYRRTIEIKCPELTKNHLRTIRTKQVPKEYVAQVQGGLWVMEYDSCDFISFDARLEKHLQLCIVRVDRDETYIKKLAERVEEFAALVDRTESEYRNGKAA
jgi:hypothetical protein